MPHGASSGWVQTGPPRHTPFLESWRGTLQHLLPVLISAEAFARQTWPCRACKANSGRLERCTPADPAFQNVDFHATEGTKKSTREDFLWKERILRDKQSANRSSCRGRKTRESDAALALLRSESRFLGAHSWQSRAVVFRWMPTSFTPTTTQPSPSKHSDMRYSRCWDGYD